MTTELLLSVAVCASSLITARLFWLDRAEARARAARAERRADRLEEKYAALDAAHQAALSDLDWLTDGLLKDAMERHPSSRRLTVVDGA